MPQLPCPNRKDALRAVLRRWHLWLCAALVVADGVYVAVTKATDPLTMVLVGIAIGSLALAIAFSVIDEFARQDADAWLRAHIQTSDDE